MKLTTPVLTAALLAALAGCASTQQIATGTPPRPAGGHGLSATIGSYDANNDGVVTRAEFDAIRTARFNAADKNGDGWLSEDEYVAEYEGRLKKQYADQGRAPDERYQQNIKQAHVRFAVVNRARDGKFTRAEDLAIADRTFKSADTNGDGKISKDDPPPPRNTDNDGDGNNSRTTPAAPAKTTP